MIYCFIDNASFYILGHLKYLGKKHWFETDISIFSPDLISMYHEKMLADLLLTIFTLK